MTTKKQQAQETSPKSILRPEQRGVQRITGYRGKGKSWFASAMENPALTAFYDFEKKGEGIHNRVHFGLYLPVTEVAKGGNTSIWDVFSDSINGLEAGRFTHAIIDNSAPLELAMKAEAYRNADKYARQFAMDTANIRANRYGGLSGVVNYLISEAICNVLWAKGVQLITVTSHIKPRWQGGVQVANSFNIKGADRWEELSILTLIMVPGDFPPAPSAIVMKEQLGLLTWDEVAGKYTPQRRLPYRLPIAEPSYVIHYLDQPADLHSPQSGEVPTQDEVQPFNERLTREQISMILSEIKLNEEQRLNGGMTIEPDYSDAVRAKRAEGLDDEDIAEALNLKYAQVKAVK